MSIFLVVQPISLNAKLSFNTKPETNTSPNLFLAINSDDFSVVFSKEQFNNILEMLESFEKVKLLTKIREKRPVVPIKDHAKEWYVIVF